jgi:flagellin
MAEVGATKAQVEIQDAFNLKMIDNVSSGVSRLVDANMEEESAKLSAQQTQQQLAIQSLSIANNTPRTILTLFQ